MILVTVILPVYNVEKYLKKGIESVLSQTYRGLEVILVDDGSTDSSGTICDEYAQIDSRVHVIHKENGGLASARNVGIRGASGQYIAYVDSDDWVEPAFVERLLNVCIENSAEMSICRYRDAYDEEIAKHEEEDFQMVWTGKDAVRHRFLDEDKYRISTSACNKFFKRELIADISFPEGKYYEDIVYGVQAMLNAKKVVYVNKALYNYRCARPGSIMNQGFSLRTISDEMPLMSRRNAILREAGMTDLADLVDRNYCIRAIEIYRELHNWETSAEKEPYRQECVRWFREVYQRCGHRYFHGIDKFKIFLFFTNKRLSVWLGNLKYPEC